MPADAAAALIAQLRRALESPPDGFVVRFVAANGIARWSSTLATRCTTSCSPSRISASRTSSSTSRAARRLRGGV
jgi:hypothetical protein